MSPEFDPKPKPASESGHRPAHRLLSEAMRNRLPKIEAVEGDILDATAHVRFVAPDAPTWSLYVAAFDGEDTLLGLWVSFYETQVGRFSLSGCEEAVWQTGMLIEVDDAFEPAPLGEVQNRHDELLMVTAESAAKFARELGLKGEEPGQASDPLERLMSRKGKLIALWRQIPSEYQASVVLELLGTEFVNEWSPWVREQVLYQLYPEGHRAKDSYMLPEIMLTHLQAAGFTQEEIAQFDDGDLRAIRRQMWKQYMNSRFEADLWDCGKQVLDGKS